MKLLLSALLITIATTASGQFKNGEVNTFANELVELHDGYIKEFEVDGDYEFAIVGIPSVYNFDLVRSMTSVLVSRYTDINTISAWNMTDSDTYQTTINVAGTYVVVAYFHTTLMIYSER